MYDRYEARQFDRIFDIAHDIEMTDDVLLQMLERKGVNGTLDTLLQASAVQRHAREGNFEEVRH